MLGRRKPAPRSSAEPDPDLPLSLTDAAELRSQLAREFAERGIEVTIERDRVVGADDREFGLWNVAAMCADAPRRRWPGIIAAHVDSIRDLPDAQDLTEEMVRHGIHERIQGVDSVPDPSWFPSATVLSDVLISIPVVDTPTQVMAVAEENYAAVGGVARWRDVGRAATRRVLDMELLEHAVIDKRTGVHVVMGDSFFTASLALHLPDLMVRFKVADHGRGVVVALPFRHQIAFHPITGASSIEAIQQLFALAMRNYAESPGGVTPHLHLVLDGRWTRITLCNDDGEPGIDAGPELVTALEG